jgi:flagellar hook-associated protein 1 FlgK
MSSLFGVLGVALDGMLAQQGALDVTGSNVSNASTPGYARRIAVLQTADTGLGVSMSSVERSTDDLLQARWLGETGLSSAASTRADALDQLQQTIAPQSGGLGQDLNALYASFTALSAHPSDPATRSAVLSAAGQVAQDFSGAANEIASQRSSLYSQAQTTVTDLNDKLARIAKLNDQIAAAKASGDPASGLADQRDTLVEGVANAIGAQPIMGADGRVTLLSSGTALVDGSNAATVSVGLDASGNLQFGVTRNGTLNDITSSVSAGSLGGIREARDTDMAAVAGGLDQVAYDVSTSINAVQSAGFGLDGVGGRNLFTAPSAVVGAAAGMAVDPSVAGNPQAIAASTTAAGLPGGSDNAVALAQLAGKPLGGASTPADDYGNWSSALGQRQAQAASEQQLRAGTTSQLHTMQQSNVGVSLEEETVNLQAYQSAFSASSKVLQTADNLLGELMSMTI